VLPMLTAANASADRIARLEAELVATARSADIDQGEFPKAFETIEFADVVCPYFDRSSETTFRVGPIDFTLRRGDLVFITGGNGSGKSTFMKLLSGLYIPESGTITLDGMPIGDNTREKY